MKVNIFIVGAPKCATTSVANNLDQNEDFFLPSVKETNFFCTKVFDNAFQAKNLDDFYGKSVNKFLCDASPSYLHDSGSAQKIFQYNPNAEIIIILRNPVKRMVSHYLMERYKLNRETLEIQDAIKEENRRNYFGFIVNPYIFCSMYYEAVKTYLDLFGNSVHIFILEKEINISSAVAKSIGVNSIIEDKRLNMSRKSILPKAIHRFLLSKNFYFLRTILPKDLKVFIAEKILYTKNIKNSIVIDELKYFERYFKDDIEKLEKLINQDLSIWRPKEK